MVTLLRLINEGNIVDYEFWFYMLIAFLVGRICTKPLFYIGNDQKKYDAAWVAILLRK
jgi:hypothetical protein